MMGMRGILFVDRVVLQRLEAELDSVEERADVGGRSCACGRRGLTSLCIMCCLTEGTADGALTNRSVYTFVRHSVSFVQHYVFDIHVYMCLPSVIQGPTSDFFSQLSRSYIAKAR